MYIDLKNNQYLQYFSGTLLPDSINFIYQKQNHNFDDETLKFIENNWRKEIAKNPKIYNGKLYDIIDIIVDKDNKIDIIYDIIDYKTSIATKKEEYKQFSNKYISNHLCIAGILKTSDNKLLIGSDLRFKNNLQSWKFPGGFFDGEKDKTIIDCLKRECMEEIGKYTFLNSSIINISKNIKHNFTSIICLSDLKETSEQILEYNEKNKDKIVDNYEMQIIKLIDFKKEKIQEILECEFISLSPTAILGLNELIICKVIDYFKMINK